MTKNNRATGSIYEEKIAAFLKQNGFMILERNYRCKQGEIDIIAKDGKYFVFIEVKFRASGSIICIPTSFRRRHRAGLMRRGSMGKRSHISETLFNEIVLCFLHEISRKGENL